MIDMLSLVSMMYIDHYTGELAGMNNTILRPSFVLGSRNEFFQGISKVAK
jgi:hypothetical protein